MSSLETLPERVARVEGRVEEHSKSVADLVGRFTLMEGRFDRMESNVNSRFELMENRIDRLEANTNARFQALESDVNARFERVEARLDHLDHKIDGVNENLSASIGDLRGTMAEHFRWTVGLIVTTGLTLGAGIVHFGR